MSGRPGRLTRLLPLACLVAALCLLASDMIAIFDLAPPGASAIETQSGGAHHGYAATVVAVFAIVALGIAVFAGSRPAAVAVAVAGALALAIFLLVDLPDAGEVGALTAHDNTYLEVEAVPAGGFYLELVSALALALTGLALALLPADQLRALRPSNNRLGREGRPTKAKGKPSTTTRKPRTASTESAAAKSKPSTATRRPRKAGTESEAAKSKPSTATRRPRKAGTESEAAKSKPSTATRRPRKAGSSGEAGGSAKRA